MTFYDHVVRKMRIGEFIPKELKKYSEYIQDLDYVYIYIPRAYAKTGKLHRLIPSFLLPHKHYCAKEVASSVCNEYGQCTSASESTIRRWKAWWQANWKEFKSKGREIVRRERLKETLVDAGETTLAYILKKILQPFWLSKIMEEFTSEGLYAISHRVRSLVHG